MFNWSQDGNCSTDKCRADEQLAGGLCTGHHIYPPHHGRMFLYFYVWFDYSYGRSRPLTLRCSAKKRKNPQVVIAPAGVFCSHHCFFFQNSGGHELKGLVPWPFQPCQISARWGDSPTKGTPFSLKVFVSKEVATEEFAKTLKVCFLWLFVLTGVCWTKLEFWVQEGTHFCGFRCVNPISSYPRRSDRTLATNPFEAWWCVSCVFG